MIYENLIFNKNIIKKIYPKISINFTDGCFVEINSAESDDTFKIDMSVDNQLHYSTNLKRGMWAKSGINFYKNWNIKITNLNSSELIVDYNFNANSKRVYIAFDSSSLGDTLAWIPYIEEFRKKHQCQLIASTFHNKLFQENYPQIEFVNPGTLVNDLYAMYKVGCYYENNSWKQSQHPKNFTKIPLQQVICDILGLEFVEIKPKVKFRNISKQKKVGLGIHSTAQTKYWNNKHGWQKITDFLISKGYEVVIMSKEEDGYMGNFYPTGAKKLQAGPLENLIQEIKSCEFFIGISSGLSWLSWSLEVPTVLISGFTSDDLEPKNGIVRVSNKIVCNDCWSRFKFDPGDWNWCPEHKGTERQFECSKSITSDMVISKIIENKLIQ